MAIFHFRLAPVLRLRARVKDEKHWELRDLNETRNRASAEIELLEQQLRASEEALSGTSEQLLSAIDLQLHAEYALRMDRRIKEKVAALDALVQRIVEKRGELVEAMRGLKALERLREHQEQRFRLEQDALEQKFGDEVGQRKFHGAEQRKKFPG
jgi:flagellar export protein FliJ